MLVLILKHIWVVAPQTTSNICTFTVALINTGQVCWLEGLDDFHHTVKVPRR